MNIIEIQTNSLNETEQAAIAFSKIVKPSTTIIFHGDLGAGKTTFIKSLCKGLGYQDMVTSPTFTIMNEYENDIPIYHFDMYRLASADEALELGFLEYFEKGHEGICLVEWPENVDGLIKIPYIDITIEKINDTSRKIKIRSVE